MKYFYCLRVRPLKIDSGQCQNIVNTSVRLDADSAKNSNCEPLIRESNSYLAKTPWQEKLASDQCEQKPKQD